MIGLRTHARDAALTARLGDWSVPTERELLNFVTEGLLGTSNVRPISAEWNYARWKPRVALTLGYEVVFEDGRRETVVAKFHAGEKFGAPASYDAGAQLAPSAVFADQRLTLTRFPYDRELPGLERAFDARRLARRIDELGTFAPLHVRPGPSKTSVLRYKPERRAVLRLDLRLRATKDSERESRRLILRVHPPAVAAGIAAMRQTFERACADAPMPKWIGCEERTGWLFEEWLDVRSFAPTEFGHAEQAGELLARLHAVPCARAGTAPTETVDDWAAIVPEFAQAHEIFERGADQRSTWIHGDFHPDQVALSLDGSGARLLDLDGLRVGDPCADLASWIVDHVLEQGVEWRDAARPLLASYVRHGGVAPQERELSVHVARALVRSAAAALRRLEMNAVSTARERLALAGRVAASVRTVGVPVVVERVDFAKDGARIVTETHGAVRRWFAEHAGNRRELWPRSDDALPLAKDWETLERRGSVDVLAYRPGRRVVLRCGADEQKSCIVKGYRRGRDVAAAERLSIAARAAEGLSVRIGVMLEHDPRRCAVVSTDLGGEPLDLGRVDVARFERFGADLRHFQTRTDLLDEFGFDLGVHTAVDELAVIELLRARLTNEGLERLTELDGAVGALERAAARCASRADALAHRDLHDGQLLDLGSVFGWIDFDLATRADSALDAGNLIAHFELRRRQGVVGLDHQRVADLRAAFLRGLGRSEHEDFVRRLAFYESATLLRLGLVYFSRPPWAHLSAGLIASAAQLARSVLA